VAGPSKDTRLLAKRVTDIIRSAVIIQKSLYSTLEGEKQQQMKKLFMAFVFVCMTTVLLAACGGSSSSSTTGSSSATVHMGQTTFIQSSVTISKGSSLTLVDDVSSLHIIGNGQWVNGVAQPKQEPGAPKVNNVQISNAGQSLTIGPFNTAGTFQIYCSVHPNMNLTVTVH
jgi:plastocyanin